jgi:hypothetical protein
MNMWRTCCGVFATGRWVTPSTASGAICAQTAPGDRLIGGLRLVQAERGDPAPVCRAIAAALRFTATDEAGQPFAPDAAFRARLEQEGAATVLCAHCGLNPVRDAAAMLGVMKHC